MANDHLAKRPVRLGEADEPGEAPPSPYYAVRMFRALRPSRQPSNDSGAEAGTGSLGEEASASDETAGWEGFWGRFLACSACPACLPTLTVPEWTRRPRGASFGSTFDFDYYQPVTEAPPAMWSAEGNGGHGEEGLERSGEEEGDEDGEEEEEDDDDEIRSPERRSFWHGLRIGALRSWFGGSHVPWHQQSMSNMSTGSRMGQLQTKRSRLLLEDADPGDLYTDYVSDAAAADAGIMRDDSISLLARRYRGNSGSGSAISASSNRHSSLPATPGEDGPTLGVSPELPDR